MPVAEAKRVRTRSRPAVMQITVTPADIERIDDWVQENILLERAQLQRNQTRAALAGINFHITGPPGTGKSLGLREWCSCITGSGYVGLNADDFEGVDTAEEIEARFFSKVLHAHMPADAIVGPYDMPLFARTGEFRRNITNYAPGATFCMFDEVERANGPTKDSLLPMANAGERMAEGDGGMFRTNILFIVTASNSMNTDDPANQAFVDRLSCFDKADYLHSDESFIEMLMRQQAWHHGDVPPRETITLAQFQLAQAQVRRVRRTREWATAFAELRRELTAKGVIVSDRRWGEAALMSQSAAWQAGRDFLVREDIPAAIGCLWRTDTQLVEVRKAILPYLSKYEQAVAEKRDELAPIQANVEKIRETVENTPPTEMIPPDAVVVMTSSSRGVRRLHAEVEKLVAEAEGEQQDAAELRALEREMSRLLQWFTDNGMRGA